MRGLLAEFAMLCGDTYNFDNPIEMMIDDLIDSPTWFFWWD
ncbi:hypothetical protein CLV47_1244 [Antricoccus suffuscus]|uniref:Uncharacterized protein n=1 Tax=Antricoccus suffuscus TaxID=1629062 RepID=A0A2T0ZC40_9ACTN|nr:hypothetical protein [Antricoccus suffuscus]PRZ33871.1 hypothetical protein CLV47_1244 [Antricoccus suffuscus]